MSKLSWFEEEILEKILNNEIEGMRFENQMAYPTLAFAAFIYSEDEIAIGPIRWGHRNNIHTDEGSFDSWDISPFSGAWMMVPKSRILRVRHVKAMF
jgi:hypothetical protein